jgi:hypothetical protein
MRGVTSCRWGRRRRCGELRGFFSFPIPRLRRALRTLQPAVQPVQPRVLAGEDGPFGGPAVERHRTAVRRADEDVVVAALKAPGDRALDEDRAVLAHLIGDIGADRHAGLQQGDLVGGILGVLDPQGERPERARHRHDGTAGLGSRGVAVLDGIGLEGFPGAQVVEPQRRPILRQTPDRQEAALLADAAGEGDGPCQCIAADVDAGGPAQPDVVAEDPDVVAEDEDVATPLVGLDHARGVERAGDRHRPLAAPVQHDLADRGPAEGTGLDDAVHVDQVVDDAARLAHLEDDEPGLGHNFARLADPRLEPVGRRTEGGRHLVVDGDPEQPVAVEVDREGRARGELHGADPGSDGAAVGDPGCDQSHEAATGRGDLALVDHEGAGRGVLEAEPVAFEGGVEVAVGEPGRGGDEASDVDLGIPAEGDAGGVAQHDAAIGLEAAVDRRGLAAGDPVDRQGLGARLHETDRLVRPDREALPVNDRPLARLGDSDAVARGRDRGVAAHHLAVLGAGHQARAAEQQGNVDRDDDQATQRRCDHARFPPDIFLSREGNAKKLS